MTSFSVKHILKNIEVGEELIIETEKELLYGKLDFKEVNYNFIRLCDVRDLKDNISYTSSQLIPVSRIRIIKPVGVDELESSGSTTDGSICVNRKEKQAVVKDVNKDHNLKPSVILTSFEWQLLQTQMSSIKIISYRDQEYHNAIADIKSQSCIALEVEPRRSGRNRKTVVITIATGNSVYIFDILSLGKVFEDLKAILRADRPQKAVYNSRILADHMEHLLNLQINGISDVFVAFCIVTKQKKNFEFEDIVSQYFGISKEYFTEIDSHVLYIRPLNQNFVGNCARRVCLILKLNECLQKNMLSTYYSQCKDFARTFADNEDSAEVSISMQNRDDSGYEYIQPLNLSDQSL